MIPTRIIFLILFLGTSTHSISADVYSFLNSVSIDGLIEVGDAEKLRATLKPNTLRIYLRSGGGLAIEAMKMATLIRESGKEVMIRTRCGSACAHYLFPAGKHRIITSNGYLVFHAGTDAYKMPLMRALVEFDAPDDAEELRKGLNMARPKLEAFLASGDASYKANGLNTDMMKKIDLLTAPEVRISTTGSTTGVEVEIIGKAQYDVWVPDAEGLREIGLVVEGFERPSKDYIATQLKLPLDRIYWGKLSEAPAPVEHADNGAR